MSTIEDIDYTSDIFISNTVMTTQQTVSSKKKNWRQRMHLKRQLKKAMLREEMISRVESGLKTNTLNHESKGYSLLLKMGYKTGQGLGSRGNGIVEPITIDVSQCDNSRIGLGRSDYEKEKIRAKQEKIREEQEKQKQMLKNLEQDYKLRMREKYLQRRKKTLEEKKDDEGENSDSSYGDDFDDSL